MCVSQRKVGRDVTLELPAAKTVYHLDHLCVFAQLFLQLPQLGFYLGLLQLQRGSLRDGYNRMKYPGSADEMTDKLTVEYLWPLSEAFLLKSMDFTDETNSSHLDAGLFPGLLRLVKLFPEDSDVLL